MKTLKHKDKAQRPEKTFPKFVAAFLVNDLFGIADKECGSRDEAMKRFPPEKLEIFLKLNFDELINRQQLRQIVQFVLGCHFKAEMMNKLIVKVHMGIYGIPTQTR